MTVADLIEELKQYDPQLKVIMAKDAEGNDFSPLDETDQGFYLAETIRSGSYTEVGDVGSIPAVFIWPIN